MGRPAISPVRRAVLEEVARRVPALAPDGARVGIDGVDGAGKTVFADHLAVVLGAGGRPVVRVSVDDFHHRRAVRYRRGRASPEGFWLDSYDYPALRRCVLEPFDRGGSRRYRAACHDLDSDRPLDPPARTAPPGSVLVVDGLFLHRDELVDAWDLTVFLQVPFAVSVVRMAARDGSHPDPAHPSVARYVGGQRLYFDACRPWERADLVVDATDLDAPALLESRRSWFWHGGARPGFARGQGLDSTRRPGVILRSVQVSDGRGIAMDVRGEDALLAEQVEYYRAVAEEYFDEKLDEPGCDELVAAVDAFDPSGDVLELAPGPGTWTSQLLRYAATVTAVDASPEMLSLARERVANDLDRVRLVQADLFAWRPDRRYDVVFMGFWVSHVPWERFADFWARVEEALAPGGRVLFVDDAYRTEEELIEGEASSTIQRRLRDGTLHRAVKVPHTPAVLERELAALGWDIRVRRTSGPFYWGEGGRNRA